MKTRSVGKQQIWNKLNSVVAQAPKKLFISILFTEICQPNSSWKQTVSLERCGSTVTETLENGTLIPIDISKKSTYYDDSNIVSFIKFSVTHQRLQARKNCLVFEKKGETPPKSPRILMIQCIKEPYCRGFKLLSAKMWNSVFFFCQKKDFAFFFCQKKDHGCMFTCFFFLEV